MFNIIAYRVTFSLTLNATNSIYSNPSLSISASVTNTDVSAQTNTTSVQRNLFSAVYHIYRLHHVTHYLLIPCQLKRCVVLLASNPAVLRISTNLGHVRRYRKTPSISMVGAPRSAESYLTQVVKLREKAYELKQQDMNNGYNNVKENN